MTQKPQTRQDAAVVDLAAFRDAAQPSAESVNQDVETIIAAVRRLQDALRESEAARQALAVDLRLTREANAVLSVERDQANARAEALEAALGIDALTGLPNRSRYMETLSDRIAEARRYTNMQGAVMFMDLDKFKPVNDTMGHAAGDQALIDVGEALQRVLRRERDVVARISGDEFGALIAAENGIDRIDIRVLSDKLRAAVAGVRIANDQFNHTLGVSIGVITFDSAQLHGIDASISSRAIAAAMLEQADVMMYRAKRGEDAALFVSFDVTCFQAPNAPVFGHSPAP